MRRFRITQAKTVRSRSRGEVKGLRYSGGTKQLHSYHESLFSMSLVSSSQWRNPLETSNVAMNTQSDAVRGADSLIGKQGI